MSADFQYDVFLSHNSKDKAVVRLMAERLRAGGLEVWPVAPKRLRGGGFEDWVLRPGDSVPAAGRFLAHFAGRTRKLLIAC